MAADVDQHDRVVGAHRAKARMNRKPLDGGYRKRIPFVLMPPPTHDPLSRFGCISRLSNQFNNLVPAPRGPKIQLHKRLAQGHVMAMAVDESWKDEVLRFQFDDPRVASDQGRHLLDGAHRKDLVSRHGHRFCLRVCLVQSEDPGSMDNQVCRDLAGIRGASRLRYP